MNLFSIGDAFTSFDKLDEKIKTFKKMFVKLSRRDSRTIERSMGITPKRQVS